MAKFISNSNNKVYKEMHQKNQERTSRYKQTKTSPPKTKKTNQPQEQANRATWDQKTHQGGEQHRTKNPTKDYRDKQSPGSQTQPINNVVIGIQLFTC
jgi:hypothetical protein